MGYRKTRGIILHRRDLFEQDREVVLLTPEYGGLTVRAPNARKSQRVYCGRLEPPNEVDARLYRAREGGHWTLTEVSLRTVLADLFEDGLRQDLWPLLSLYRDLFPEGKNVRQPYQRLLHGLRLLQEGFEPSLLVITRVLGQAAVSQGLDLTLRQCVECGRAPDAEGFLVLDRGYLCTDCGDRDSPARFPLGNDTRLLLQTLLHDPWERVIEGTVSRATLVGAESLLYRLFHFHFEINVDALKVRRSINSV